MLAFDYEVCGRDVKVRGVNLLYPKERIDTAIGFGHPIVAEAFVALIELVEYRVKNTYFKSHTVTFEGDILLIWTEDSLSSEEEEGIREALVDIMGLDIFFKTIVIEPY
ncbi:hypothetical protein [Paenibacillus cymbidii]|uniref:hypothetical protein n=1 Tax=Paenibacillus cymbidii TaxID=1639034 RepID=UPI0010813715|nr:hypothetical protein [Paenibacillus cymbidii]